ncbi:MAG TPA: DUF4974 domain-containing protein [Niabella sp.]|nr:DUF4974 domain-containing protein [Niabella sp.]HOZ98425.1 DUF4974 domain-containing protein [Niabella sp.]HQW16048.1 DUF4974 domain-containing protein [Niabella sp.]HQX21200.1 DUF4974 domain-containing protein [Niabella sp.]HQX42834.1 DUF4974 domain-containing protein [Niabella sp.]
MIFSIDELIIDDSFILYCQETDADAIRYWNDYLLQYPEQLSTMQEAKEMVLVLKTMLLKKQNELSASRDTWQHSLYVPSHSKNRINELAISENGSRKRRKRRSFISALSLLFLLFMVGAYFLYSTKKSAPQPLVVNKSSTIKDFIVKPGDKRTLYLADSTKVVLNANSALHVDKDFATKNRNVFLVGEALFDVAHNKQLPFVVHLKQYKVRAMGTKFNVKAYKNDLVSETSLLEGKVQILMNKGKKDVVFKTLVVNQKFVFENRPLPNGTSTMPSELILPLKFDEFNQNVETAWVDDQLIFDTQSMDAIARILERRFDIAILIQEPSVKNYKYTASFKEETLDEILQALQLSFPFSYKKEGKQIIINK